MHNRVAFRVNQWFAVEEMKEVRERGRYELSHCARSFPSAKKFQFLFSVRNEFNELDWYCLLTVPIRDDNVVDVDNDGSDDDDDEKAFEYNEMLRECAWEMLMLRRKDSAETARFSRYYEIQWKPLRRMANQYFAAFHFRKRCFIGQSGWDTMQRIVQWCKICKHNFRILRHKNARAPGAPRETRDETTS